MNNDRFNRAYAVGYYYGRAMMNLNETLPAEDMAFRDTDAFKQGVADGYRDFQDIDLATLALKATPVDPSITH